MVVVGVTGIDGRTLSERLVEQGWEVRGSCRRTASLPDGVEPVAADLSDRAALSAGRAEALEERMTGTGPVWDEIVIEHGLLKTALDDLAYWWRTGFAATTTRRRRSRMSLPDARTTGSSPIRNQVGPALGWRDRGTARPGSVSGNQGRPEPPC